MDILALLRGLKEAGITDLILLIALPLLTRHAILGGKKKQRQGIFEDFRASVTRLFYRAGRRISSIFAAKFTLFGTSRNLHDARFDKQDARIDQLDRKNDSRAYDMTLHLIDVRERLANIEGRLGMYPPRRGVDPPIPEPAAEPESNEPAQS